MNRVASSPVAAFIALDHASSEPLYRQLYQHLRNAILTAQSPSGTPIPSSRELARELGIARNTVLTAVEQLRAEGYLQGERGSGTYVNDVLPEDLTRARAIAGPVHKRNGTRYRLSARATRLTATRLPQLPAGLPKPFRPAVPALDAFPFKLWASLVQKRWKHRPSELLGFGDPAGYLPLRRAIASYLSGARAVQCEAEQVIIVSGAQQALDTTARVLLDPGDAAWMEEPGYPGAREAFAAAGARIIPVPVDSAGMNIQTGITRCAAARLVYVTPSHQFPLGVTLTLARRLELLHWSRRAHAWIVEDDYDSEYRYSSRPIASLQGLDPDGRVIYVGTFSKVLFPSLRLGYLIVPAALVETFTAARIIASGQPPLMEQAVLAEFITEGHFGRHLRRMRALYAERQEILFTEAHRVLAGFLDLAAVEAGLDVIGWLPPGIDDRQAAARAAAAGVETTPLSMFRRKPGKQGGLLLGFAAFAPHDIRRGVERLARALQRA